MYFPKRISLFALGLLASFTFSCKDDDAPDNQAPVITIISPTDAALEAGYDRGETITLSGEVTDDGAVMSVRLEVFFNGVPLFDEEQTFPIEQARQEFTQDVTIPAAAPSGRYQVELTATDDEGESSTVRKEFDIR